MSCEYCTEDGNGRVADVRCPVHGSKGRALLIAGRFAAVKAQLTEENPEALLADGFEKALIGVAQRCGQPSLAVYDVQLAFDILVDRDGLTYEEAAEHMSFNVLGSWNGPHSPVWLWLTRG